ncbi:MAG: hypothetical protein Q7T44_09670 [Parvibaculum sp.]|nr:hypothetical protein [Parvibaculum sp.]
MVKHYDKTGHQVISTQDARSGVIILRTRGLKLFFFAAMVSLVIIPALLVVFLMP